MRKRNKAIAAVLIVVLGPWSLAVAFGVGQSVHSIHSGQATRHSSHGKQDHSCCPGVRSDFVVPFIVPVNSGPTVPCSDRPCCAKRVPANPALVTAMPRIDPGDPQTELAAGATVKAREQAGLRAFVTSISPAPAYPVLNTVLRI